MSKFKITLSIFFLVLGITSAVLTFNLSNKNSYGFNDRETVGGGVDSSNDGVAVGLGIISGFSFLSSVLLLNSISKNIKE